MIPKLYTVRDAKMMSAVEIVASLCMLEQAATQIILTCLGILIHKKYPPLGFRKGQLGSKFLRAEVNASLCLDKAGFTSRSR